MSATTLAFQTYLDAIRTTPLDHKTEHTDRAALETLLKTLSPAGPHIQHEPTRQGTKGSPDFKVTQTAAILGYIEVKTIGENLDAVLKSPQIKKYLTLSGNIILTDYLHFIWLHNGAVQQRESFARPPSCPAQPAIQVLTRATRPHAGHPHSRSNALGLVQGARTTMGNSLEAPRTLLYAFQVENSVPITKPRQSPQHHPPPAPTRHARRSRVSTPYPRCKANEKWASLHFTSSTMLGLGLYIATETAHAHNGTLTVTSTPKKPASPSTCPFQSKR